MYSSSIYNSKKSYHPKDLNLPPCEDVEPNAITATIYNMYE